MFTTGEVNVALLPAESVTVTCCVRPAPSWLNVTGLPLLVEYTPEVASLVVNGMRRHHCSSHSHLGRD